MSLKFFKRLLILCFIFLGSTQYTYADKPEYQVKALSLVLFLKYISFNDKRDEFHIGVFGDNPFAGHLKKFDGQKIKNRKIRIHLFQNNLEEASRKNCHLIFLGGNNGPAALPGKPMESQLIKYVTHEDIDERMPPKEKDWLTEKEIENLKTWIAKGMAWPK